MSTTNFESTNNPGWKELLEKLRDPNQTVGDIQKFITNEKPDLYKLNNVKTSLFKDEQKYSKLTSMLDTIMHFFLNGNKKDYLECRYNQNLEANFDGSSALNQNIRKILINGEPKEIDIQENQKVADVFQNICNALSRDHKLSNFTGFIKNEFLNWFVSDTKFNNEKKAQILQSVKDAIEKSEKKQVIFTGAPGTGKTYNVEEYVKDATQQKGKEHPNWEFVQFHSSYDYTDFVEGLRPVQQEDKMVFVRMDGIFKSFCRKVVEANEKIDKFSNQSKETEGNGESHSPKEYETYYFIIDEINRADLGRVFGELMYCFEKRGEDHTVKTQYHNLPTYDLNSKNYLQKDVFEDGFYIPENIVILGTMNDIDRSVETFDFALRRRFDWVEIKAEDIMEDVLAAMGCNIDIVQNIEKMNKLIKNQSGLGEAFAIGPSYFKGYKSKTDLEKIWERNIKPILREYMRGRQNITQFLDKCYDALFSLDNNTTENTWDSDVNTDSERQL